MKRSSKVGLLISVFSLLSAMTLGISYSKASQESEDAGKKSHPVYSFHAGPPVVVLGGLPTWEEKRQLFDQQLQAYEDEVNCVRFRRLCRQEGWQ